MAAFSAATNESGHSGKTQGEFAVANIGDIPLSKTGRRNLPVIHQAVAAARATYLGSLAITSFEVNLKMCTFAGYAMKKGDAFYRGQLKTAN